MNNKIIILFGVTVVLLFTYYLYQNTNLQRRSSNFKSYQTEIVVASPVLQQKLTKPKIIQQQVTLTTNIIPKTSAVFFNKNSSFNPIINSLDHKFSKWSWSPNVFVLEKNKYKGPKNNIIGSHDGFEVIKDKNIPKEALNIVYNSIEKRLGIYMGKIIIVHQKETDFEDKIKNIAGVTVDYVSGVYFLSYDSLAEATQLVSTIQNIIPSTQVDLDINYAFDRAN